MKFAAIGEADSEDGRGGLSTDAQGGQASRTQPALDAVRVCRSPVRCGLNTTPARPARAFGGVSVGRRAGVHGVQGRVRPRLGSRPSESPHSRLGWRTPDACHAAFRDAVAPAAA